MSEAGDRLRIAITKITNKSAMSLSDDDAMNVARAMLAGYAEEVKSQREEIDELNEELIY